MQVSAQRPLRIGTRGSPLALAQAGDVRARLCAAHGWSESDIVISVIRTSGDRIQDRPLSEVGGKGLFTKELEDALLGGEVDLAVHSMKDVATELPAGLSIASVLEREDPRDAFISLSVSGLDALPSGATVGTSSLRRHAQVRRWRPDLVVTGFRGNVETRLRKLAEGQADATFLAVAGLRRLGMSDRITAAIETDTMLPAVAQGAVGIEIRADNAAVAALVAPLNHAPSAVAITAERAFLAQLEGSCRTPIAGLALIDGDRLSLRGELLAPDGSRSVAGEITGSQSDAAGLGRQLGAQIAAEAGPGLLAG